MSNIIKISKKPCKDCKDWVPLADGTKTGDTKYCDLSRECRQIGMKTDWYKFYDFESGSYDFDYFCTGNYADPLDKEDNEVS